MNNSNNPICIHKTNFQLTLNASSSSNLFGKGAGHALESRRECNGNLTQCPIDKKTTPHYACNNHLTYYGKEHSSLFSGKKKIDIYAYCSLSSKAKQVETIPLNHLILNDDNKFEYEGKNLPILNDTHLRNYKAAILA